MKKRHGFTLSEILIMLVIMGMIAVLSAATVSSETSNFTFTCYHLFRDLKIAVGHMAATTINGGLGSSSCEMAEEEGASEYQACIESVTNPPEPEEGEEPEVNPYILNFGTGTGFCQGLARKLGTASRIKCSAGELNNATLDNVYGNIANGQEENFRLINRYLVYVSDRVTPGSGLPYRIVSFDINGNSKPNKIEEDIISFAILDNGEVLPLGKAANNTKYFITVIKMRNILEMPANKAQEAVNAIRHPTALIMNSNKEPLTFKDGYCKIMGSSDTVPSYCNGYTDFDEKFRWKSSGSTIEIPVSVCFGDKYNSDGSPKQQAGETPFVAECEFNVVKPHAARFIPIAQDVYSSVNNEEDTDAGTETANQIYQY